MPAHAQVKAPDRVSAGYDAELIEQLHRIHRELRVTLAAAHAPLQESADAAFKDLRSEINALAQKFLQLSDELMARGLPAGTPPHQSSRENQRSPRG